MSTTMLQLVLELQSLHNLRISPLHVSDIVAMFPAKNAV